MNSLSIDTSLVQAITVSKQDKLFYSLHLYKSTPCSKKFLKYANHI